MKKALLIASVASMIESFNLDNIQILQNEGFEVHVMANFQENDSERKSKSLEFKEMLEKRQIKVFDLPIQRNPLTPVNVSVYNTVRRIMKSENYTFIHCHTPIGGVLGRLASRESKKKGTRVIYTAHGFHFYRGAPKINWLIYYTIEKTLSPLTDCLITINPEDYNNAITRKFKTQDITMINGVGISLSKFSPTNDSKRQKLREQYGYSKNDVYLIYVGELSDRKNQWQAIRMMHDLVKVHPEVRLLIVGDGSNFDSYSNLIKDLDLIDHVYLLGYRSDISNLMSLSDIAISTSRQEGLPVNIMEAMATGLPLVVTDCRGNRDLIQNGVNGYMIDIDDTTGMKNKLVKLIENKPLSESYGIRNKSFIRPYDSSHVNPQMTIIYKKYADQSLPQPSPQENTI